MPAHRCRILHTSVATAIAVTDTGWTKIIPGRSPAKARNRGNFLHHFTQSPPSWDWRKFTKPHVSVSSGYAG